ELVHRTTIDGPHRGVERMVDIVGQHVRLAREWNDSSGMDHARRGAVRPGKRAKVIIEGAVLFDDENNVLNPPKARVVMMVVPSVVVVRWGRCHRIQRN